MERGLLNIVNYGRHDRFRHVIICLTEAGEFARQLRSPSCQVIELRKKPGNDLRLATRIAQTVRECGVTVLHARGWPTLIETAFAARLAGIDATIYGFHGKTAGDLEGLGAVRRVAQALALRSYHRVVTLNQRMRADLAAEGHLSEERIHIIANGVDLETFRPREDRDALRAQYGLPSDRFIVGNIARLDPVKNHEVILRALSIFSPGLERPFFLLVGEGEHRHFLERAIRQLHLEGDVCLLGFSSRTSELLSCMDVYIQSSLYEGFSNTVLEAMSVGLPVIASDAGGTRDLFEEGREGLFFNPEDEGGLSLLIRKLWRTKSLQEALGKRARERVVNYFSVEKMAGKYESLYLEVEKRQPKKR